jgi:hypothetical protein
MAKNRTSDVIVLEPSKEDLAYIAHHKERMLLEHMPASIRAFERVARGRGEHSPDEIKDQLKAWRKRRTELRKAVRSKS